MSVLVILSLGNVISLKNFSPLHFSNVGVPTAFWARDRDSSLALFQAVKLKSDLKVGRDPISCFSPPYALVCLFVCLVGGVGQPISNTSSTAWWMLNKLFFCLFGPIRNPRLQLPLGQTQDYQGCQ